MSFTVVLIENCRKCTPKFINHMGTAVNLTKTKNSDSNSINVMTIAHKDHRNKDEHVNASTHQRLKDSKYNMVNFNILQICDALRDLVPFAQLKKREKHPWRSVNFSKVAG